MYKISFTQQQITHDEATCLRAQLHVVRIHNVLASSPYGCLTFSDAFHQWKRLSEGAATDYGFSHP
jgi:hypothetical protein